MISKFKDYPRKYEYLFSPKELVDKKCNLDLVEIHDMDEQVYVDRFRDLLKNYDEVVWDSMVKLVWLAGKFSYRGIRRTKSFGNGFKIENAYGVYVRSKTGFTHKMLGSNDGSGAFLRSYIEELLPNLQKMNPYVEKIHFPFPGLTTAHLFLVQKMDERAEILKVAMEKKMTILEFMDYVVNYIMCYNEEHPGKYDCVYDANVAPYVRNLKRRRKK